MNESINLDEMIIVTDEDVVDEFLEIDGGQLVGRKSRAGSGAQLILKVDGPFLNDGRLVQRLHSRRFDGVHRLDIHVGPQCSSNDHEPERYQTTTNHHSEW